jgi:hypothetical protein
MIETCYIEAQGLKVFLFERSATESTERSHHRHNLPVWRRADWSWLRQGMHLA